MTLNELIAQLQTLAVQGYGDHQVTIDDEDEQITKQISRIQPYSYGKFTTIDITVGR